MNVNKIASNDANRWLAAEMAYGQGAGTRRKLLWAELGEKMVNPKYAEKFEAAYAKLDMDKFAKAAIKERKHLDHVNFVSKNARALLRGDVRHVSPLVYAAILGGYYAHQTGYDKVIWARLKAEGRGAKKIFKDAFEDKGPIADDVKPTVINLDDPYGYDPTKPYGGR